MVLTRSVLMVVVLALMLPARTDGAPRAAAPLQLTRALIGRPIVAGTMIYWVQQVGAGQREVVAYDGATGRRSVLERSSGEIVSLTAGHGVVAWIDRATNSARVRVWSAATGGVRSVLDGEAAQAAVELAVGDGVLVYGGRHGIWSVGLAAGATRRLAQRGAGLVAGGGRALWSTSTRGSGSAPEWQLWLAQLDGGDSTLLARSTAPFSGYSIAGDNVVWSALPPAADRRAWLYRVADGSSAPISAAAARAPRLNGSLVSWLGEPGGHGPELEPSSLRTLDLSSGRQQARELERSGLAVWGTLGDGRVLLSDERAVGPGRPLWLDALEDGSPARAGVDEPASAARSLCGKPVTCGQLSVRGQYLYDAGGRWDPRGVQFFLPRFGINAWTFYDHNYWPFVDEVDSWLDIARYRLRARLLRIFIELPGDESQFTSVETVYDFARRAGERGMRVGIVVQNSADFRMTPQRRAWLDGMVAYFGQHGASPLIAYISAANEINNWCSRDDCFDKDAAYADAAINWTAEVVATVKARNPALLVTVGLSSEVDDLNGLPAVYDFFRTDAAGRSLAGAVDFLAPHNYAGGAYGVYDDLRHSYSYNGPIVLEEFGWTTDPLSDDPRFTEGAPSCVADPWAAPCANTGPYFVEWSLRAMREVPYAGGVAWMLADVQHKNCASDPSDLWSGLFAAGEGYCGGTRNVTSAHGKATASRVALFYGADDLWRLTYLPGMAAK